MNNHDLKFALHDQIVGLDLLLNVCSPIPPVFMPLYALKYYRLNSSLKRCQTWSYNATCLG